MRSAAERGERGAVRVFVRPLAMLAVGLAAAALMWRALMSDGAGAQHISQAPVAARAGLLEEAGPGGR